MGFRKLAHDYGLKHGDIFVGTSLLATSSHLLDKHEHEILDVGSLLNLCSLINDLTLHDRIITLTSGIHRTTLFDSTLYKYLTDRGLIKVLEFDSIKDISIEEKLDIEDLLGTEISNEEFERAVSILYAYDSKYDWNENSPENRRKLIKAIIEQKSDNFDFLRYGFFHLRTAIYWVFSNACNIPFQPDLLRIPIIYEYNSRIRQSLRMFIAASIDKLQREELDKGA